MGQISHTWFRSLWQLPCPVIAAVHGDGKLRINWPQVEALASEAVPPASFDIMLDSVAAARVLARLLIVARSSAQDGLNAR